MHKYLLPKTVRLRPAEVKPYSFEFAHLLREFHRWLGCRRKEGDRNDCYEVFSRMVWNSDFPETLEQLLSEADVI